MIIIIIIYAHPLYPMLVVGHDMSVQVPEATDGQPSDTWLYVDIQLLMVFVEWC